VTTVSDSEDALTNMWEIIFTIWISFKLLLCTFSQFKSRPVSHERYVSADAWYERQETRPRFLHVSGCRLSAPRYVNMQSQPNAVTMSYFSFLGNLLPVFGLMEPASNCDASFTAPKA
jgi:hypothetical protein